MVRSAAAERERNMRGNSVTRQRRRERLCEWYAHRCFHCSCKVTVDDVQSDRINPGGPYTFANVQASCAPCNRARSNDTTWVWGE
jgi:hypothetical protein